MHMTLRTEPRTLWHIVRERRCSELDDLPECLSVGEAVEREVDIVPRCEARHAAPNGFDRPCSSVADHHRQRSQLCPCHDREIRPAQAGRADFDERIARCVLGKSQLDDLERS